MEQFPLQLGDVLVFLNFKILKHNVENKIHWTLHPKKIFLYQNVWLFGHLEMSLKLTHTKKFIASFYDYITVYKKNWLTDMTVCKNIQSNTGTNGTLSMCASIDWSIQNDSNLHPKSKSLVKYIKICRRNNYDLI